MRPVLHPHLEPNTFKAWYWLKAELQAYCRSHHLNASGSKAELMQRISSHLDRSPQPTPAATHKPKRSLLPKILNVHTVIEPGWPLSKDLRDFFVAQVGASFRFNQALRDLFKNPQGETLADAVAIYARTQGQKQAIGAQFQFNQHMRDFFTKHPGASHQQALQAWHAMRQRDGHLNFFELKG